MDTRLRGYNKLNHGFTLVELSIVLLVIGLLVSGVLVGKDMIRAAELRSIAAQKDQLQTSVMLFQDKYQGILGDLKNATAFWGVMPTGTCATSSFPGASGATGTQTCNGTGSGFIETIYGGNSEFVLFWQHMANAGFAEGKYTGIWGGAHGIAGQEMETRVKNVSWHAPSYGIIPISHSSIFEGDYGNTLQIIGTSGYTLTPTEAWGIDTKIDDGLPGLGKVVTMEDDGVNCSNVVWSTTVAVAPTATYNLEYESPACSRLVFRKIW